MNPKFFTVDEANALVGYLEAMLERIRRNRQRYLWLQQEIGILRLIAECGADEDSADALELSDKLEQLDAVEREIRRATVAIRETGCILRDPDRGLIDFFSIQNNTVVYLSWKRGEDRVRYWRPIRESDATVRRPLEEAPSA